MKKEVFFSEDYYKNIKILERVMGKRVDEHCLEAVYIINAKNELFPVLRREENHIVLLLVEWLLNGKKRKEFNFKEKAMVQMFFGKNHPYNPVVEMFFENNIKIKRMVTVGEKKWIKKRYENEDLTLVLNREWESYICEFNAFVKEKKLPVKEKTPEGIINHKWVEQGEMLFAQLIEILQRK